MAYPKFDANKYKKTFENMYGKGAYDKGMSQAREIGRTKAQAAYEKDAYTQRLKAAEKAAKEAEKAAKNKTYDDALSYWNENKSILKKGGAYDKVKDIRNDPRQQADIKAQGFKVQDFIDAMYAVNSDGEYRSEREFNGGVKSFQNRVDARKKASKENVIDKYTTSQNTAEDNKKKLAIIMNKNSAKPSDKKSEKKNDGSGLSGLLKKTGNFFTSKDVNNDGERDGLLGLLDSTAGRASSSAQKLVFGKDFVDAQNKNYRTLAKNNDNKQLDEMVNAISRKPKNLLEKGSDILGTATGIASYIVPGSASEVLATQGLNALKLTNAGSGLAARLATQTGEKGLSALAKAGTRSAISGGASGLTFGVGETALRELVDGKGQNATDNLKRIGKEVAFGAIGNPVMEGIGKLASTGVQNGLSSLAKGDVPTFTGKPSQNVIDQLGPVAKNTDNNQFYDNLINDMPKNNAEVPVQQPSLERLRQSTPITPRITETPSLNRLKVGRDYEPIEAMKDNGGPLIDITKVKQSNIDQTKGDADSFRGKINRKPKKENTLFKGLRTQFIDDIGPLEDLEKQITGKVGSAENSLYKQGRLFKGSAEKAHLIVKEQLVPVINDIKKTKHSITDLGDYALAVHAKDVNANGMNSGFTNAEIDDVIRKLGTPEMEAARKQLVKVNNDTLDMLSTGPAPVLNPDDVANMKEKWPNYMSLFRSFDDDKVEFASGISKTLSVGSSPIQKLKGSSRDVIDPIESMVKNIFKATNVADRNKVSAQLGKLATDEKASGLIRQLADGEDVGRVNVITTMDKGKPVKYEVPPDVYTAMKNLDKESSNTLIQILQKPAGTLRAGATLTPEFSLRNPLRDVPQAFVVSESGFNPAVDFPVGLWQSIWKGRKIKIGNKEFAPSSGELYKQFIKENGGYGNIVSMDRNLHKKTLQKAISDSSTDFVDVLDPKTYGAILKKLANPINTLRTIADVSETATKVGEFRAALRKGETPQEAAYRARDIMDYSRAGVSVRQANKVVAFLNANIQGKSKLFRAFKANPAKVTGKAIAAVTIPTIGAIVAQETMSNDKQREILDDSPQWLKDTFYLVPVPGTDQIARIPKPFDLAYPFSNSLERAFDYVKKNDKEAFDGFIKQSFSAAAVPTMLTGLAPIVEGMANYSFFRQGPIIPQREQGLNYPDQYDINTSETAKLISKGVNKATGGEGAYKNFGSPRVVDNSIQGFFGGLGTYATKGTDSVINLFTDGEGKPEKPAKGVDQQPLAKAFLVNKNTSGSLDKLYKLKEKIGKDRNSAKQNGVGFNKEQQYKELNKITDSIGEINKGIRQVENSTDYSAQEKRRIIDAMIKDRNNIAKQTVQYYKE